jgi:hypothetical protein
VATPRRISDIKPLMTNLAQTSHYEVKFGTLPPQLMSYLRNKGINSRFIAESAGLLCYSAVLPTTTLGSFTVDGNFMGVQEKFANSRIYSEITLDFYVDSDYQMLNFLECWMEFIASGSFYRNPNTPLTGENPPINQNVDGYFVRMQYPKYYKADAVSIVKFDRDYRREIEYNFRGLFPLNISSIPVSYMASDVMKVSASFQYDRYIVGKANSFNIFNGNNNNLNPLQPQNTPSAPQSAEDVYRASQETFTFGTQTNQTIQTASESLSANPLSTQANPETLF